MVELPEEWVWVPFEVDKLFNGFRIDRFLARRLQSYSRNKVQKILEEARVLKEGRAVRASSKVRTGDRIQIAYRRRPEEPLPPDAALDVLFEDEDLLIIDKPSGLLSHPTDKIVDHTVLGVLRQSRKDLPKLHLLHRLDRETSGVLALAKNPKTARAWTAAMEKHRIQKEYLALVHGAPKPRKGSITWPIGRQGGEIRVRQWINVEGAVDAMTRYEIVTSGGAGGWSLVRAYPQTGRLHQIRVHFAALGYPVLGDYLYTGQGEIYQKMINGTFIEADRASLGFPRVALHAAALSLSHPLTQKVMCVRAELPTDMAAFSPSPPVRKQA